MVFTESAKGKESEITGSLCPEIVGDYALDVDIEIDMLVLILWSYG